MTKVSGILAIQLKEITERIDTLNEKLDEIKIEIGLLRKKLNKKGKK